MEPSTLPTATDMSDGDPNVSSSRPPRSNHHEVVPQPPEHQNQNTVSSTARSREQLGQIPVQPGAGEGIPVSSGYTSSRRLPPDAFEETMGRQQPPPQYHPTNRSSALGSPTSHTRPLSYYTSLGSPLVHQQQTSIAVPVVAGAVVHHPRSRSYSLGSAPTPMGWNPIANHHHHQHANSSIPHSTVSNNSYSTSPMGGSPRSAIMMHHRTVHLQQPSLNHRFMEEENHLTMPDVPFLVPPPEHTAQHKAMEAASAKERQRIKLVEPEEATMSADELRFVLKRERQRTVGIVAELASIKSMAVTNQLEAEVLEEGRVNHLMRRLDTLKAEKERIIIELEREEEMVRSVMRKQQELDQRILFIMKK